MAIRHTLAHRCVEIGYADFLWEYLVIVFTVGIASFQPEFAYSVVCYAVYVKRILGLSITRTFNRRVRILKRKVLFAVRLFVVGVAICNTGRLSIRGLFRKGWRWFRFGRGWR